MNTSDGLSGSWQNAPLISLHNLKRSRCVDLKAVLSTKSLTSSRTMLRLLMIISAEVMANLFLQYDDFEAFTQVYGNHFIRYSQSSLRS